MCLEFRGREMAPPAIGRLPVLRDIRPKSTILAGFQEILIFVRNTRFSTLEIAEILKISKFEKFISLSEKECLKNTLGV